MLHAQGHSGLELRPEDRRDLGHDVCQPRRLAHGVEQPGLETLQARHVGKHLQTESQGWSMQLKGGH
jgi:hypothetical protein